MSSRIKHTLLGAHDADRTRDLVLTKDVLYQLSYVGLSTSSRVAHTAHVTSSLQRAVGVEPTTASLEGWDSTAELRPPFILVLSTLNSTVSSPLSNIQHSTLEPTRLSLVGRQGFEPWKPMAT